MKKQFIPKDDKGKELWLKNFANNVNTYATKYNITVAEVSDMVASALHFTYWLNYKNQYAEFILKLTAYKNEARDGIIAGATPSVVPAPPALGVAPAAVAPGIFVRANSIALRIKKHNLVTEADMQQLGLIGEEQTIDVLNATPEITLRTVGGGKPEVVWNKGSFDGVEIWVDRGEGFVFLAVDSHPNYTDTSAMPAPNASQVWKYKAIYLLHDERVGNWSAVVSINVGG